MPETSNGALSRTTSGPSNSRTKLWAIWFGVGVLGYIAGTFLVSVVLGTFFQVNYVNMALASLLQVTAMVVLFLVLFAAGYLVQRRLGRFDPYGIVLMTFAAVVVFWVSLGLLTHNVPANPLWDWVNYSRNGLTSSLGAFAGAFVSKRR